MMNKNSVRLTESQLKKVIEESVRKVIDESVFNRAFKSEKSHGVLHSHGGNCQYGNMFESIVKSLLNEDAESKAMDAGISFLEGKGYSRDEAKRIFNALRNDIPSVRLPLYTNSNGKEKGTYKFLIGVERMYIDGELRDGRTISELNKTLKLLASAHADEYDNNLNGLNARELVKRFEGLAKTELENDINDVNSEKYTPNGYSVVKVPDFETASEYGDYTNWCVTHYEGMYNAYTSDRTGLFYFFLKDGFENVEEIEGESCPLDEYGLSMIAVSINMDGSLNTVTCRWNHDNDGNDNIMDAKQLSRVVGMNVYSVCKPYTRDELHAKGIILFDDVQDLLDNGTKPNKIFDVVFVAYDKGGKKILGVMLHDKSNFISPNMKLLSNQWFDDVENFHDGFAIVEINGKCNFIDTNGKLLSNQWFDYADDFSKNGFARVEINGKWNLIDTYGELLSKQWFDDGYNFSDDGFAHVGINGKWNYIDTNGKWLSNKWFDSMYINCGCLPVENKGKWNLIDTYGELLSKQWFDSVGNFSKNGYARVGINGKYNYININGKLLSNKWFDDVYNFNYGFVPVENKGKWNLIDKNGKLLNDKWFDSVGNFSNDGFVRVEMNGKLNYFDTNGKLLSNKWFDDVENFHDGFAIVEINGKCNFIDTNGKLLSNQWFDYVGDFHDDYANVEINGKWNYIDTNGKWLSNQWFDYADDFSNGFGDVGINGKYYLIDKNGVITKD